MWLTVDMISLQWGQIQLLAKHDVSTAEIPQFAKIKNKNFTLKNCVNGYK